MHDVWGIGDAYESYVGRWSRRVAAPFLAWLGVGAGRRWLDVGFLGGQGPAPGYAVSLSEECRAALRDLVRDRLPAAADGSIPLTARAWAVRGLR